MKVAAAVLSLATAVSAGAYGYPGYNTTTSSCTTSTTPVYPVYTSETPKYPVSPVYETKYTTYTTDIYTTPCEGPTTYVHKGYTYSYTATTVRATLLSLPVTRWQVVGWWMERARDESRKDEWSLGLPRAATASSRTHQARFRVNKNMPS